MEKNYVGIDVGKRSLEVVRLLSDGKKERFKCGTDVSGIDGLLNWLKDDDVVGLEAGSLSFYIARMIKGKKNDTEVIVLNPGDILQIYKSLKKTDKEDALKIARLIHRNPRSELPEVSVPSADEQKYRGLIAEHDDWKKSNTRYKNRLHSLYVTAGITTITRSNLRTKKSREKHFNKLPVDFQGHARRIMIHLENIDSNIDEIETEMKGILKQNLEYTELLMSMPGMGLITTFTLFAYLGDGSRFSNASQLSYYAGLVPRVDISGDTVRYGRLIKRGCRPIKRVIIQCSWSMVCSIYDSPLKQFYDRQKDRIGKKKSVIAVARKMLETVYTMIKNGEYYRGVPDDYALGKLKSYGLI